MGVSVLNWDLYPGPIEVAMVSLDVPWQDSQSPHLWVPDLIAATVGMLALLRSANVGQYLASHAEQHVV
jgi:hypothetical protein